MNVNAVADEIYTYLATIHERVYRNRALTGATFPYVVYRVGDVTDTYPSDDFYVDIDVYEQADVSVRTMNTLADSIDDGLNDSVRRTSELSLQFNREQRQFIESNELITAQAINMRYVVRTYFI